MALAKKPRGRPPETSEASHVQQAYQILCGFEPSCGWLSPRRTPPRSGEWASSTPLVRRPPMTGEPPPGGPKKRQCPLSQLRSRLSGTSSSPTRVPQHVRGTTAISCGGFRALLSPLLHLYRYRLRGRRMPPTSTPRRWTSDPVTAESRPHRPGEPSGQRSPRRAHPVYSPPTSCFQRP